MKLFKKWFSSNPAKYASVKTLLGDKSATLYTKNNAIFVNIDGNFVCCSTLIGCNINELDTENAGHATFHLKKSGRLLTADEEHHRIDVATVIIDGYVIDPLMTIRAQNIILGTHAEIDADQLIYTKSLVILAGAKVKVNKITQLEIDNVTE